MKVKIYNKSNNELPKYKTSGAAGMDARASFSNIDPKDLIKYGPVVYTLDAETKKIKSISMQPGSRVLVPLDIHTSIPEGYMITLHIRSGVALKDGLILGNAIGIIDFDYRGNYGAILVNPSWNKPVDISEGDIIGISEGKIMTCTKSVEEAVVKLLEGIVDMDDIITLYYGEDVTREAAESLKEKLEEIYDDMDVELHRGGQPLYYYILSVE